MPRALFRIILPTFLLILLFLAPQAAMQGAKDGFLLWASAVLPALFPFYAATSLMQRCGALDVFSPLLRPFCRLFRLPDAFGGLLLAGWLSGTPNGARLLADSCDDPAVCTRACACLTVTSPLFLIGTAGSFLGSPLLGALVYAVHWVAALCTGLLWRSHGSKTNDVLRPAPIPSEPILTALPEALRASCLSLLFVGGAIAFFSAVTSIFRALHFLPALQSVLRAVLPADAVSALLSGFFEVSQGTVAAAQARLSLPLRLSLLSAFAAFGGVSVLCQAKVFLKARVRASVYMLQRLVHAALSFCLCRGLCLLFSGALPVFSADAAPIPFSMPPAGWIYPALVVLIPLFARMRKGR